MSDSLATLGRPTPRQDKTSRLGGPRTDEEPIPALPGYDILRRLGHGGMGVVYLARDRRLGRLVALKMIRAGALATPEDLVRFDTEARAVAGLQHPNIVQLHESGWSQGLPYFTLEYLPGGTLADRVEDAPLTAREAARVVRDLARALAHAHAAGILHRDLKPENVLLAEDGTPKITDFGLARQLQGAGLTGTRDILGTPDYMAPEQARGDAARVGFPADIYALGAILYRLVTGRPPFQAPTGLDTLRLVLDTEPVPVRALAPACPRDLETICLKCLRKEAGKRYAAASALAADLDCFLAGQPIAARPVGAVERCGRWVLRNPVVALLLLTTFAALVAGVIVSAVFAVQAQQAATEADDRRTVAEQAVAQARTAEAHLARQLEQTRGNLFTAQLARLTALVETHPDAARRQLLDRKICPPELRDPVWGWLAARSERAAPLVPTGPRRFALAFHPEGHLVASVGAHSIELIDLHALAVVQTLRPPLAVRPHPDQPLAQVLTFTRDGKHLVGAVGPQIVLWETATGQVVHQVPSPVGPALQLHLTPEGSEVWVGALQRPYFALSLDGNTPLRLRAVPLPPASALAFAPDGKRLAVALRRGAPEAKLGIELREWPSLRLVQRIPLAGTQPEQRTLTFSGDGQLLAGTDFTGVLRVWDLPRHTLRCARSALQIVGTSNVTFHPTLPLVALATTSSLALLDVQADAQERLVVDTQANLGLPGACAFHPAGRWLAYHNADGRPLRLDLTAPRESLALTAVPGGAVLFEPAGTMLAHDRSGTSRRYDLDTGAEIGTGPTFAGPIASWSRTGPLVAVAPGRNPVRLDLCDRVTGACRATLADAGPGIVSGAIAPDGLAAVVVRHLGDVTELRGYNATTGQLRWGETLPAGVQAYVTAAPAGRLAVVVHNEVTFRDLATGALLPGRIVAEGAVGWLACRPDGTLAFVEAGTDVVVYDPASGQRLARMGDENRPLGLLALSPDGRTAVTLSPDRVARLWDLGTQSLRLSWPIPGVVTDLAPMPTLAHPEFTPDGRRLAIITDMPRRVVRVYDVSTADEPARRALALTRQQVERLREEPWNVARHEALAAALTRAGKTEQAALHAAWALWQRR